MDKKTSISTNNLILYQRLLLITMIMYPVFGVFNTYILEPAFENTAILIQRFSISILIGISLILSCKNKFIANNFYSIIVFFVYLGYTHLTYVAILKGFELNHTIGMIMVLMGTSLVFKRVTHLAIYHGYAILITLLASHVAPDSMLSSIIISSIFFTITLVLYIGMSLKIKAEKQLIHNEANLKAIIENTDDLIWSVDTNLKVLTANSKFIKHSLELGINVKIGEIYDISSFNYEQHEWFINNINRAIKGEVFSITIPGFLNQDEVYEHFFNPINNSKNVVKGVSIHTRNISKYVKSERLLRESQNIAKIGSFERNFITTSYTWSDYMYELFQLPKETDLYSIEQDNIIHPDDYKIYHSKFKSLIEQGGSTSFRYRLLRPNKTFIHVLATTIVKLNNHGELMSISGTIQDISDQVKQEELEKQNSHLLNEKEQLERNNKEHQKLLFNISEQIKNPLFTIEKEIGNLLQSSRIEQSKKNILNNVLSQTKVIEDYIHQINIDETEINIALDSESIQFKPLIESIINERKVQSIETGISIQLFYDDNIPESVKTDKKIVQRIFRDLIDFSFSQISDGKIVLSVEFQHLENNNLYLKCKCIDTGKGMNEKDLAIAFEKNNSSNTLAIIKHLIQTLGGKIILRSWEGLGNEFEFTFPVELISSEENSKQSVQIESTEIEKDWSTLKILLVEDNPFNQLVATETISDWNNAIEVDIAENGEESLEKLSKNDYHIILMDIQMPIMDGHEATKKIRNEFSSEKASTPIIAVTAHAFKEEIDKCFSNGVNDYISKPYEGDVLIDKIKKYARF